MQRVGPDLLTILESTQRDLPKVDLFEFYPPDETDLFPENAEKRFAATTIVWNGWTYQRQAISRGDISRFIDGKFNNCTITLSNIDRSVSTWLSATPIEGYRVRVRMISRSVDDDSLVLGVFRCEKPFDVDNTTVQINAKQDLGSIENDLPWNVIQPKCPLKFKGVECLAGQLEADKSAAYQAATVCNKSWRQCKQYENQKAFQGVRFTPVTGNFKVSQRRGGAGGAFLSLLGLGNKRVTKQYSSQDATSQGQAVTLGLGRTQVELTPIVYADTGEYLALQAYAGEGEITKWVRTFNVTSGWADTFQAYDDHPGAYGFEASQGPSGFFGSNEAHHSHRAYVEITIKGTNPDTGDAAPTIVAVMLWLRIPVFEESCFTGDDWSDNPVEQLRFLLTEPRSLNYDASWIDNEVARETALYCNEPLIDQTGGEDVYISTTSGTAGVDYKRYRSTGLLDTYFFLWRLGLTTTYPAEREVTYNTFNPASPPSNPTPTTYYRKRYTSNWHLREKTKVVDFIFKNLLPCFRGYLVTGGDGRLQIRSEKPTVNGGLVSTGTAGATQIAIEDVGAWKALNLSVYFALIGVGESTSETRRITNIAYAEVGPDIEISSSGSGGLSVTTTAAGGIFEDSNPAATAEQIGAQVTFSGTGGAGKNLTITIDGEAVTYTTNANDTVATAAAIMATRVRANTVINRYVEVVYTTSVPEIIRFRSKRGLLSFSGGLASTHTVGQLVAHIAMPFSDVAMGALTRGNILKDSFKWPLGSRQSTFNQFVMTYNDAPQDFQSSTLQENDYDHQEKINKIAKLEISGACVDNYHQADRLVKAARFKHREGDFFNQWSTAGLALLLEEGDVVATNHSNMPGQRNLMLRVEELKVSQDHRVNIIGRLYADEQFPDAAEERTISLNTGIGWVSSAPPAVFNLDVTSPSAGTLNVMFSFGAYIGSQTARIEVKREGETDFSDTGLRITPDSANQGFFQLTGIPDGLTEIRITPFSVAGDGPSTTESFDSDNPDFDILEYQVFDRYDEMLLELEVFS